VNKQCKGEAVRIELPGVGKSLDAITAEAFKALNCEPWGGPSQNGWSKNSDFLRCPYRYYLKHIRGAAPLIVGVTAKALDIGACMHLLLAARYAAMLVDNRYPGWRETVPTPEVVLAALVAAGLPIEISSEVERLYDGYAEKWNAETLIPVAVEMPAGVVQCHTSRYDLVFYVEDGIHDGLWVGEHKTMSSSTDIEEFRFHGEVIGEMLSWDLSELDTFFGAPLNGICINGIIKARQVPRYQRLWISKTPDLIELYAKDRSYWLRRILECVQRGWWPRSLNGCFGRYNNRCRFWEHCRTQDESQLVQLRSSI
jgi:hypothetical protein